MLNKRNAIFASVAFTGALILSACASSPNADSTVNPTSALNRSAVDQSPPAPQLDPDRVVAGEAIYDEYCSSCHRADLSGDPEWKKRNSDGSLRPPPHDSNGHTWHHSDQLLLTLTRDGAELEESRMPAFGAILTDDEIISVLEFLKSTWGHEERAFQWHVTWTEQQRTES